MAVSRTAPDGTYRWARNELYPDTGSRQRQFGCKPGGRPGLAFAPDPLGTASADEWFWGASWLRFNPIPHWIHQLLKRRFSAGPAGAFSPTTRLPLNTAAPGTTTLNYWQRGVRFIFSPTVGFGPLRGYLHRDYDEEVIVGAARNTYSKAHLTVSLIAYSGCRGDVYKRSSIHKSEPVAD